FKHNLGCGLCRRADGLTGHNFHVLGALFCRVDNRVPRSVCYSPDHRFASPCTFNNAQGEAEFQNGISVSFASLTCVGLAGKSAKVAAEIAQATCAAKYRTPCGRKRAPSVLTPLYRRACPFQLVRSTLGQWSTCGGADKLGPYCGKGPGSFRDGAKVHLDSSLCRTRISFNPHKCVEKTPMATNLVSLIMNFLT